VATSLLVTLSGNFQTNPNFFLNWKNGVKYRVMQAPQYKIDSLQELANIPIPEGSCRRRFSAAWPR
jgi:hypothetical protein